jgi:hypothetical protein
LAKASDSIRINREFDSNEIVEIDLNSAKQEKPRTSISRGISIDDELEKLRINV